jgi:Peptidase family M23
VYALVLLALVAPVQGEVTRGFDPGRPFEGGRHRGVDLAAAPGTPVRAACSGPVAFAGRIGATGIVTLRCGPWRVTHMPLATIAVRSGGVAGRGAVIGTAGSSPAHDGLHLGMRRDGTRFGYVDPLRFLARRSPPVPLGRAPRGGRRAPPPDAPRPIGPPSAAPRLVPRPRLVPGPRLVRAPRAAPRLVAAPHTTSSPLAPWPAWAGLALVLAGVGLRIRSRRRAAYSNPVVSPAER